MQAVTIQLPNELYEQLKRTAELTKQPVDTVIAQSLSHSLSPLLTEIPTEYQSDVFPLFDMSDTALQKEMERKISFDSWSEYDALLQSKKERPLTNAEETRLSELRYQADLLTFRKAYAAVLLKRRGHRISPPSPLPPIQ